MSMRPTLRIERGHADGIRPFLRTSRVVLVFGDKEFEVTVRAINRRDVCGESPLVVIEAHWPVEEIVLEPVAVERINGEDGS